MSLVVADTTPINYLVLCEAIHVLPELYQRVVLPNAVYNELNHARTPPVVRGWISNLPTWACIRTPAKPAEFEKLGLGEREAISLARDLHADYLLIDERLAREVAAGSGLAVVGTVGVLEHAGGRGLIDLPACFEKLRRTNFRCEPGLFEAALARVRERRAG